LTQDAPPSQPSLGGPSTSAADNGPADYKTHGASLNDSGTGDFSGANPDATETQAGHQERIQPEPLEQDEDNANVIHLPDLQTTQRFIQLLGAATLEKSGMQHEDIESLRDPGPVVDFEEPSPLLRNLRHFINNASASRAYYDTTGEIELLDNLAWRWKRGMRSK